MNYIALYGQVVTNCVEAWTPHNTKIIWFVKYVTDKFKGVKYADITVPEGGSFDDLVAIKNDPNIGEKMDKVIYKLAEEGNNNLTGVVTNAHFNDESKLGKDQEMVDKLTGLISIFQRPELLLFRL